MVCPKLRPVEASSCRPSPGVVEIRSCDSWRPEVGRLWTAQGFDKNKQRLSRLGSMAEAVRPPRRAKAKGSRTKTKVRGTRPPHSAQPLAVACCLLFPLFGLSSQLCPSPEPLSASAPTFPYLIPLPIDTRPVPLFLLHVLLPDFARSLFFLFPPVISLGAWFSAAFLTSRI